MLLNIASNVDIIARLSSSSSPSKRRKHQRDTQIMQLCWFSLGHRRLLLNWDESDGTTEIATFAFCLLSTENFFFSFHSWPLKHCLIEWWMNFLRRKENRWILEIMLTQLAVAISGSWIYSVGRAEKGRRAKILGLKENFFPFRKSPAKIHHPFHSLASV